MVYADADPGRLERAAALGAEPVPVPAGEDGAPAWRAKLGRFGVTVDASGRHGGLHVALRATAPDGTCTSVAIYFEPATPVPLLEMHTRGCTLHTGRCHARADPGPADPDRRRAAQPGAGDQRGGRLRRRGSRARRPADQAHPYALA